MTIIPEEEYKKFKDIGPSKVRENIALGVYNRERTALAYLWLAELERAAAIETNLETRREARSAKKAAWASAIAAILVALPTVINFVKSFLLK